MHIYMSQRALQEAHEALLGEILPFAYTMLKKGYDIEGIMEFLQTCDDEDLEFVAEDADILTEGVVDSMTNEEVNYYGERLEFIAERFGISALKGMSKPALIKLARSNPQIAKLIKKLGLLSDDAIKGTRPRITVPSTTRTGTIKRQQTTTKPQQTTTKPQQTTTKPRAGTKRTIAAIGAGLVSPFIVDKLSQVAPDVTVGSEPAGEPGPMSPGNDGNNKPGDGGDTKPGDGGDTKPGNGSTKTDSKPKEKETGSIPWWLGPGGDQTKLGRRPIRYDVALQSYRNPSQSLRSGFEMVADYLISEGHADTVEEARYVINQMDKDDITEILNEILF